MKMVSLIYPAVPSGSFILSGKPYNSTNCFFPVNNGVPGSQKSIIYNRHLALRTEIEDIIEQCRVTVVCSLLWTECRATVACCFLWTECNTEGEIEAVLNNNKTLFY